MSRRDGPDGGVAVGFVDDHPAVLQGLVQHLRAALPQITATHTASDVAGLVAEHMAGLPTGLPAELPGGLPAGLPGRPGSGRIDLVLLDIQLGDRSVPEHNVAALRGRGARVLLYSQETRASVVARCLQAGAFGIVSKSEPLDVVTEAVRCVLRGEPHLNADWAAAIRADTQRQQPAVAPREEEALRNNVVKAGIYPTWVAVLGCAIAVLATVSYLVGCARGRPSGMPNRALAPLCLAMMAAHVVALAVTRRRRAATRWCWRR